MDIQQLAEKEIGKVEIILKGLKLIDKKGEDILKLINSYFTDAKYFHDKKQFIQAFEAAVMCWTYVDAGLHLGVFSVPDNIKKLFTI